MKYSDVQTPYYIYNKQTLDKQVLKLVNANIKRYNIHFALMANNNIHLLNLIQTYNIGVFTSSIQELKIALQLGFVNDKITFCSSNLKISEIEEVSRLNPIIVADSLNQLRKYISYGKIQKLALRLSFNPEFYKKFSELEVQRQGISENEVEDALEICKAKNVKVIGVHTYLGTNISEIDFYKNGIRKLLNIALNINNIKFINISGGFGLNYQNIESNFDFIGLVNFFKNELSKYSKLSKTIELKIEPGRYIIGPAGKLICSVTEIIIKNNKVFIGVDTNLSNFPRPYIYKKPHVITVYQRKNNSNKKFKNAFICGNSAKSDDFFALNTDFPFVEEGDLLCIHYAGAYCYSMSSNFCALLRPAEYLLNESGKIEKIREAETLDSLLNTQQSL